jgi:hypothetical protein
MPARKTTTMESVNKQQRKQSSDDTPGFLYLYVVFFCISLDPSNPVTQQSETDAVAPLSFYTHSMVIYTIPSVIT